MKTPYIVCLFIVIIIAFAGRSEGFDMSGMQITSPAFRSNGLIPEKFTCDGLDINPALSISGVPANARSLVLIVDDPDAPGGTWVHWVVWNIDPRVVEIKEGSIPQGAIQGINDFRKQNYGGPCPPSGTHRYFFKLYALDTKLDPGSNSTKSQVEKAMRGHIIDESSVVGLYKRR
jgi:Raf kinase inhibitor-like YbhB/YbcL family protein